MSWMSAYISPPTLLAPLPLEQYRMQEVEEEDVNTYFQNYSVVTFN